MFQLVVSQLVRYTSNCSPNRFLRPLKTSDPFALVTKQKTSITRETYSIESSKASWPREVILPIKMELVERVSMVANLMTNKFGIHTLTRESFPWPTPALIPMAHNSSFALVLQLI